MKKNLVYISIFALITMTSIEKNILALTITNGLKIARKVITIDRDNGNEVEVTIMQPGQEFHLPEVANKLDDTIMIMPYEKGLSLFNTEFTTEEEGDVYENDDEYDENEAEDEHGAEEDTDADRRMIEQLRAQGLQAPYIYKTKEPKVSKLRIGNIEQEESELARRYSESPRTPEELSPR